MRDNPQSGLSNPTRRTFLLTTGSTAAATIVAAYAQAHASGTAGQSDSTAAGADGPNIEGAVPIILRINGKDHQLRVDPRTTLLDCIRETVALTGTKKGCDHGQCGACTVHVNGRRVNSRLSPGLDARRGRDHKPLRASARQTHCILCRQRSLPPTGISADIARQARSCRRLRCSRNHAVPTMRP